MDIWPEFLYGNMTIDEYIQLVNDEKRDIYEEIMGLTHLIQDVAKHPFEEPEHTFVLIRELCNGIRALIIAQSYSTTQTATDQTPHTSEESLETDETCPGETSPC